MKEPPIERRRHPRVKVSFTGNLSHDAGIIAAQAKDLSCSGACCIIDRYIESMTRVAMLLLLPGANNGAHGKRIECQGVVVRCEPLVKDNGRSLYQIGIYFLEISKADLEYISRYIQQALSKL